MTPMLLKAAIAAEDDVVLARQRARELAELLGFEPHDQVRVATAVSEIARIVFRLGNRGVLRFWVEGRTSPQLLRVSITSSAPLRIHPDEPYHPSRPDPDPQLAIVNARRLMDSFEQTAAGPGTEFSMSKLMPAGAGFVDEARHAQLLNALGALRPPTLMGEIQEQNRELVHALDELRRRHEEILRLNAELEDTNRGVVALYAELDERADHLRRADEMKSRFLSNMSHEFRTPLNAMLALTRLMLDRDAEVLTDNQRTELALVRKAAMDLSQLVDDLLDLAKAEAGKIVLRPAAFEVSNLFGALRGMLRPLLVSDEVALVFDEPAGVPVLHTDEAKVSQILRNFISNALKFTERGEVRVRAQYSADDGSVRFSVSDTGLGIAPDDQEHIFKEFTQVEHAMQRKVRGTGLGLPLSRRLAELLGGRIELESTPGEGSIFTAVIPALLEGHDSSLDTESTSSAALTGPSRQPVLVVEDATDAQLLYVHHLAGTRFDPVPARSIAEAQRALRSIRPAAIVLDISLPDGDAWALLAQLKRSPATRDIPVLVISVIDDPRKGLALGADAYSVKPAGGPWLREKLEALVAPTPVVRVLIVDDDEASRHLLRQLLPAEYLVSEAADGRQGLAQVLAQRPSVILMDLVMPSMDGFELMERLVADPSTRDIPVIVVTSMGLTPAVRAAIEQRSAAILQKSRLIGADAAAQLASALTAAGLHPVGA